MIANSRNRGVYRLILDEFDIRFGQACAEVTVQVLKQFGLRPHRRVTDARHEKLAAIEDPEEVDEVGF